MNRVRCFSLFTLVIVLSSLPLSATVAFDSIWAYLMKGEERFFDTSYPVSDIGYFGATMNSFGKLVDVPDPAALASFPGKKHLVVAEVTNRALTHFCLNPAYPVREQLLGDIVLASKGYDGVQIDFELVSREDAAHFLSFLVDLKERIGKDKVLSIAVPARIKAIKDDAYDYKKLARVADTIIVMAYDEHWSGSAAGPVASMDWCRRVATYSKKAIGTSKLVMGMPFYGRSWTDNRLAKAYKFSTLDTLLKEKAIQDIQRRQGVPWFEYQETVRVKVFYEDTVSIVQRSMMYRVAGVRSVSFWRLGQEDPLIWKELSVKVPRLASQQTEN